MATPATIPGTVLDLPAVRARFPALSATTDEGRPVVHADAPGGTQVPQSVIDAIGEHLARRNANAHGRFPTSQATDALCDRVRRQAAEFTGGWAEGVVFGPSMTALTWHLTRALDARLGPGDQLVCTRLDHDANVSPWIALARRTGATVRWVEVDPGSGRLDLDSLDRAVTGRTRWVAFPGASNALGTVVDPEPFVAAARAVGARTFMDAVHAAPHVPLAQRAWGIDVLACSPYKFCGPHLGLLSAEPDLLADLTPDRLRPAPDRGPERWQTGTAQFEAIAGTGAALTYLGEIGGMEAIRAHEATLSRQMLDGLRRLPAVRVHGPEEACGRTPTFCLTVEGQQPQAVVDHLVRQGVYCSSGNWYAVEPICAVGLDRSGGGVRVGFSHYHRPDDVGQVLNALAEL